MVGWASVSALELYTFTLHPKKKTLLFFFSTTKNSATKYGVRHTIFFSPRNDFVCFSHHSRHACVTHRPSISSKVAAYKRCDRRLLQPHRPAPKQIPVVVDVVVLVASLVVIEDTIRCKKPVPKKKKKRFHIRSYGGEKQRKNRRVCKETTKKKTSKSECIKTIYISPLCKMKSKHTQNRPWETTIEVAEFLRFLIIVLQKRKGAHTPYKGVPEVTNATCPRNQLMLASKRGQKARNFGHCTSNTPHAADRGKSDPTNY